MPASSSTSEARAVLAAAVERHGAGRVVIACSFQKEASVVLDLALSVDRGVRVITLDTGLLFAETYALWRQLEERYAITVEAFSGPSLGRQAALHGEALWAREPDACCGLRKVEPLARALAGAGAWVTGLRRDQAPSRADTPVVGWDERRGIEKLAPLAAWSEADVWRYLREHELPYHPLHDRGYASIGCTHCTRPGAGRDGRWAGAGKTECGLHA